MKLLPRLALTGVAVFVVIAGPIVRAVMWHRGVSPKAIYSFTACRLDTLAVGSLLAVLVRARPAYARRVALGMLAVGGAALAAVIAVARGLDAFDPTVQIIGFGGVVLWVTLSRGRVARALGSPVPSMIGRYSYGIYLFHYLLVPFYWKIYDVDRVTGVIHSPVLARLGFTAMILVATTGVAALSWRFFERPLLALKDRWAPAQRA